MNPVYKKKWIEALRSGTYTQTSGVLKRRSLQGCDGIVCCAQGVLREVLLLDGFVTKQPVNNIALNREEWDHLELDHSIGCEIAKLNDSKKMTFDEIADWIERNL